MITVIFQNETTADHIPSEQQFQCWIDVIAKTIPDKIPEHCHEICIAIIDAKKSAVLNERYRQKQGPTNVLSFAYDAMPGESQESLGDLAICADIVQAEASAQEKPLQSHWAHMTIHGILHLLGYDHVVDNDAVIMETLEIKILNHLGIENPYV